MYFDKKVRNYLLATVSMGAMLTGIQAKADPSGGEVIVGDVNITGEGTGNVIVNNDSLRSIVEWDSFSIGVGETTTINQVTDDAAILNRVVGDDVSDIYGTLKSNGQVFLINENGIVIGETGIVDTNGFVASTLDASNSDFLAGGDIIFGNGIDTGNGITVHGKIRSVTGGDVFLLSREIEIGEKGSIDTNGGVVGLGAGEEILLKAVDSGDGRISIRAGKGKIVNRGSIAGAAAELRAAGGNEYALAINNTGVIRARGVSKKGGKIRLFGGSGKVKNTGRIVARKKVVVRSKKKIINRGVVKSKEIVFEAPDILIEAGSLLDVSGALGGGSIHIGGGYQGSKQSYLGEPVDISDKAEMITVEAGSIFDASATESGDAGQIVIWSENTTKFAGDIVATAADGTGGFAEVSGAQTLDIAGINVDLRGSEGNGSLLLDPDDITISAATATGANVILDSDIETLLATTSVSIATGGAAGTSNVGGYTNGGGGAGDVTFEAGVRILWTGDGTLEVNAAQDIIAADDVIIQNAGIGTNGEIGGVRFEAGRDILIGSAATRTGGVAIGSEYGENTFVAGDSDFDGIADQSGNVILTGGDADASFAHLGYIQDETREANAGANGAINVSAGTNVDLTSGSSDGSFAQIGHGGVSIGLLADAAIGPDQSSIAAISADITVEAGVVDPGSVNMESVSLGMDSGGEANFTKIGHGGILAGEEALVHGDISGNISVTTGEAGKDDSHVNLNTNFNSSNHDNDDRAFAQIGHGGWQAYIGSGENGTEIIHGDIAGNVTLDVNGTLTLGTEASAAAGDDKYNIQSQVGHGGQAHLFYEGDAVSGDGSLDVVHGSIIAADGATYGAGLAGTDISVTAAAINIIAKEATQNSPLSDDTAYDNFQRSQIGHGSETNFTRGGTAGGSTTTITDPGQTVSVPGLPTHSLNGNTLDTVTSQQVSNLSDEEQQRFLDYIGGLPTTTTSTPADTGTSSVEGQLNITVTENRITGDITVIDDFGGNDGITLSSGVAVGLIKTNNDVMISRIGHATQNSIDSLNGGDGAGAVEATDGGNVTIRQAHILGADIVVDTKSAGTADISDDISDQDITIETSISAGLAAAEDNTTIAQIGHSGDVFVTTGNGGASTDGDKPSADGGDITLVKGTVWDGSLNRADGDDQSEDALHIVNTNDITLTSGRGIIVDSDTSAALAAAKRNNSESQIGHGHNIRLGTGEGGTSTGEGTSGGAGGDVLVYQGVDARDYGRDEDGADNSNNDLFDDYATGLRGDITLNATDVLGTALSLTSDDSSALAGTEFNSDYSIVGHSDMIEITSGDGGNGANGIDTEADDKVADSIQAESHGGRGGHVEVQLGRYLTYDQDAIVDLRNQTWENGNGNTADLGDTRAITLAGDQVIERQGVMLIEGDITVNVIGQVLVDAAVNNALSAANNAISESNIGHGTRIFASSGNGGNGGAGKFGANATPVFASEQAGEEFLNYNSGVGSNRGGNGGDILVTMGDITDRDIRDEDGNSEFEISHETDADRRNSSTISLNISDEGVADGDLPDSLIITSAVNGGLSEGNGSDVLANIGHHVRLFGEGGKGGDGGSSNTEFDDDGNSLYTDLTNQTDIQDPLNDGVDETAEQAGAVFIQPNSSGGRGGDVATLNGNISGDIVVVADRRVTVNTTLGHGDFSKVFSTIGHTTDVVAVTQNGGVAGVLYEPPTVGADFDGGVINVNGTQTGANDEASTYPHILVDGNQDDEFDLTGNGDQNSTIGDDGIAVTPDDIENREGSTIASIHDDLGSFEAATTGAANGDGTNNDGIQTYVASGADSVIYHDEEADPEFILDNDGTYVLNTEDNNGLYAENAGNLGRFGRVVATYDAYDRHADNELGGDTGQILFDARTGPSITTDGDRREGDLSMQVFVDMDQDGDVDLVDFDRDGRLDIVDLDHDGYMDVIDGRANYVDSDAYVQGGEGAPNGITGLGVLDYVAVTGEGFDATHLEGGWSIDNELTTTNLGGLYLRDATATADHTSIVSDLSTANGGRGGDAITHVGYSVGDISVSTGDNDAGEATSLVVSVNLTDDVTGGGGEDYHRANIGHSAWQVSDTSANYAMRRAGREGLRGETDIHVGANGGNANNFATVANGGRGGNAYVSQGIWRDMDTEFDSEISEMDHLVGNIYINTSNGLDESISNDAGRIDITSFVDTDYGSNVAIATLGHTSEGFAFAGQTDGTHVNWTDGAAGNLGGNGVSVPGTGNANSQTEIANGGDGGDALVLQRQLKGTVTVMTASDDLDGAAGNVSLNLTAENGAAIAVSGNDNLVISQIGHGRRAAAISGNGGDGDDGQWQGNGGNGGDAAVHQEAILDTGILVDLVHFTGDDPFNVPSESYDGDGMLISATMHHGSGNIVRSQVGNGDIAFAEAGNGGDGAPDWNVNEQRNQTANGGAGGDALIEQAGYTYDITLDIGHNEEDGVGGFALEIVSDAGNVNTGADAHILANVGHGGYGRATGGAGGHGGLSAPVNAIQTDGDPNLVDSDYNYNGAQEDGDTPYAIDEANSMVLGTERRGGDGGDATVNLNMGGTGTVVSGRASDDNDYGLDDTGGASITLHTSDIFDSDGVAVDSIGAGYDSIRIATINGPGSNQDSPLYLNSALAGHHSFAETIAGAGGNGIQTSLTALISEGDGGDGGIALTTVDAVWGDITISNITNFSDAHSAAIDNSMDDRSTNIVIESLSGVDSDAATHRGEARVGHLTHVAATGGAGGDASREAGAPPAFPAIISAQGGDGGDALTYQGQLTGDISITAENSVLVTSTDGTVGSQTQVAAVGHRMEGRANAALGGFGGTVVTDGPTGGPDVAVTVSVPNTDADGNLTGQETVYEVRTNAAGDAIYCNGGTCFAGLDATTGAPTGSAVSSAGFTVVTRPRSAAPIYFTYEALREYHARGNDYDGLSEFEQSLVDPFVDYFEDKPGELEIFLDRLVGDDATVIAANNRDDDFVGDTDYSIPSLIDGTGHIDGDDGELQTMLHIMAASGHGGNASVTQGSVGLDGNTDSLSASGNITLTANAYDLTDTDRGIDIIADAGSIGPSLQLVQVGHQAEAREVIAGDGQNLRGALANANGIGGDGGDATVDQYAINGEINLLSEHEIHVRAVDGSAGVDEVRAWVGHRLTVGPDYTVHRMAESVRSGNGGSENSLFDDGRNGNGGDVFITQRGVISGASRGNDGTYATDIQLVALQDSDNDQSITIEALATGASAPDVETHIGHDFLIHGVTAGNAGRMASLRPAHGASEGLLEGNGGDIFITQTDLGADIDIAGRDEVLIHADSSTAGANHAHLMIGHERTIGNSAETDNPRTGEIKAGYGGDSYPEDVNGSTLSTADAAAAGEIEDADSGFIEVKLGVIGDSADAGERLVTITSITEDVDVLSSAATGATSILEIGNQQQFIGETQSASELRAVPYIQTAGDAGGVNIARDDIYGDVLIQALDADRTTATDGTARADVGRQVVIDSTSGAGATAINQIGHETEFTAITSTPVTSRAAFGEDRNPLFETNLTDFVALEAAATDVDGEATIRDAQNAIEDMEDLLDAIDLAMGNKDRFPAADSDDTDLNDQGDLQRLRNDLDAAITAAEAAIADGSSTEAARVNEVQTQAQNAIDAATDFQTVLDSIPQAGEQIADFSEAGDIIYGNIDDSIDTGVVRGNIDVLSGRYVGGADVNTVISDDSIVASNFGGDGYTAADDADDGVVQITASTNTNSLTEVGHRRVMTNTTSFGGGDTDTSPEEGGVAGDGGSITTKNITSGDISVQAEEVVITVAGAAGTGEVHLLHSSDTRNYATGWSDLQSLLGNGGDIDNTTSVTGGVTINAERIASAVPTMGEGDRTLLAAGAANTFIHMGHQVSDDNVSNSDKIDGGGNGDSQDNLGSNRGGDITSTQTVGGNANGDLVTINLDANGDGVASDLIIATAGKDSDIRLGNGEDEGTLAGTILNRGVSGGQSDTPNPGAVIDITDDGGVVTLTQAVSGDIHVSNIEDLEIKSNGADDSDIWLGHDAEQFGQSGETNAANVKQYGERVTVAQTVLGEIDLAPSTSFTAELGAANTSGELHFGHEATQTAFSADDSENPSDFEDENNDGIADNPEVGASEGPSAGGVNDDFDQPDILATQLVEATISITTGEITLENGSSSGRLQVGHEAFHIASVDGDLVDTVANQPITGGSTGHVVATSEINPGGADIIFTANGTSTQNDSAVGPKYGSNGDIQLVNKLGGEVQVGHRSTSTMTDGTTVAEGQYNTLQAIGSSVDADGDGEVDDTSQSIIQFTAVQDILIDNQAVGVAQVGHYITEEGTLQTSATNVDGTAATGLAEGDSELRQIVGSDIVFGDNSNQGSGGVGTGGAGNNIVISAASGRAMVGHMSPGSNQWQVEDGTRAVTVQLLDGDITIEAGTDADVDAPDGLTDVAADQIKDDTGTGDDILITAGAGGVARIGHNQANAAEGVANETQASAGDIWVRAGGDLHVIGGAIGHENYDFADIATSTNNALPGSTIRDRIRGNTTISAGQNSANEDTTLIADIMIFDGGANPVQVNSGYGGIGNADVDGELRFFLPAQEGLTVIPGVTFNDSGNGDDVPARVSNPDNVFEAEGGLDHEHEFELASELATYDDAIIGPGNYGFYFEKPPSGGIQYTPYINFIDHNGGFNVEFVDDRTGGVVNIGELGGEDYFGTSSFEVACEEAAEAQNIDSDVCEDIRLRYSGIQPSFGSNSHFSATAGGNQTFENQLFNGEESIRSGEGLVVGYSLEPAKAAAYRGRKVELIVVGTVEEVEIPEELTANTIVESELEQQSNILTYKNSVGDVSSGVFEDTHGEYVTGAELAAKQVEQEYPNSLSYASSYLVYQQQPL